MRALFEKDLRILFSRKSGIALPIVILILSSYNNSNAYAMIYFMLFGIMYAISTLEYDCSNNCMSFLLTLPCTRRQYVFEKYLFVYGVHFFSYIIGLIVVVLVSMTKGSLINKNIAIDYFIYGIGALTAISTIIPIKFKVSNEKFRVVLISFIGAFIIIGLIIKKNLSFRNFFEKIGKELMLYKTINGIVILIMIWILVSIVSAFISCKIMGKKEY